MQDSEFFDWVGLPFDPPEKAGKKVKAAIEKAEKDLQGLFNTESSPEVKNEHQRKLTALASAAARLMDKDGKLTPAYTALAEERTKQEMDKLTATVYLLKQSGSHAITNGTIRDHSKKAKLSEAHVEEVFRDAGFTVSNLDPLKAYPKFPVNIETIHTDLERLRRTKDPNPNGADVTLSKDLYAFAAYLAGEPENGALYRGKPTAELANLLGEHARELSKRNDPLGKLCATLASAGRTNVFSTEENRQAYEAYLQYKSPALAKIFASIKSISEASLLEPKLAETCIKEISAVFGNYEVSLAIYNKEAGLKSPYIPVDGSNIFHVKCQHCQNVATFADIKEAQKVNKCTNCGKPLYKACQKCHRFVLSSLDKCPECGFVFAGAAQFSKFYAAAEQALRESNFESARNYLLQAQSADPGEKSKTDALKVHIDKGEKEYAAPINKLRELIAARKYQQAAGELPRVIGQYPGLNVSTFETQIQAALTQAATAFDRVKKLPVEKQAEECLMLLQDCADYGPAIQFLQAHPPEPCASLSVGLDTLAGCVNISWARSTEAGVNYRLIRKQGGELPVGELDGEVLADDTPVIAYRDAAILPGRQYSYAVFTVRRGVYSTPVCRTITLLAEVTNIRVAQQGTTVRLTWGNPKNCTGATIRRFANGTETVLTQAGQGSYEDKNLQYGVAYTYRLIANYPNLPPSRGVEATITPMPEIEEPFGIGIDHLRAQSYRVSWDIRHRGFDVRVMVNQQVAREVKSDAGSCEITLPPNGLHRVTVLAYSGGQWLQSRNSKLVNTYASCTIDREASYLREDAIVSRQENIYRVDLHLKIAGTILPGVIGFYYAVRTSASETRWPKAKDIQTAADIHRISLASYRKQEEILFTETAKAENAYYVSLFTIYEIEGKEVISAPAPCRFSRPLSVDVFWKVSKTLLSGVTLSVEFSGNRPFTRIPELMLCACTSNQHLHSYDDAGAVQLLTIAEQELNPPVKEGQNTYQVPVRQLKDMKLFLFEVEPFPNECFTLRWTKGFTGKV